MPESKTRKEAVDRKAAKRRRETAAKRRENAKKFARISGTRDWVPWVFIPLGLFGVLWLILYYVASPYIPIMNAIGNWNFLVGIGAIAGAFVVATAWK